MDHVVSKKLPEIRILCKEHQVKELYIFGFTRKRRTSGLKAAILDLMVEIDEPNPINSGQLLLSLYDKFERLFNQKNRSNYSRLNQKTQYLKEYVGTSKQLIYDGSKS